MRAVLVLGLLLATASSAAAAPYTLPKLGWTIEVPGTEAWTVNGTDTWTVTDRDTMMTATSGKLVLIIDISTQSCAWHASTAIDLYVIAGIEDGTFEERPSWLSANWYPAIDSNSSGDRSFYLRHYCRPLAKDFLRVTVQGSLGTDYSDPVSRVLASLEAFLVARGEPRISFGEPGEDLSVSVATLQNRLLAKARAERAQENAAKVAAATPPYVAPAPTSTYVDPGWNALPKRNARLDGLRVLLDYGSVEVEGTALDDGARFGAALHLPPRYAGGRGKAGWVYGARASVGKIGDAIVGDGHGTVGVALDPARNARVALLLVVGYQRIIADSTLATDDVPYAGLQLAGRLPITEGIVLEASATAIAGEHGRESRYQLSAVTGRFRPVTLAVGVHRHRWDDGFTMLGVHLGVGY